MWIYMGAQITLYSAEINVVKKRRLWPRSLVQPPLIEGDKRVLVAGAKAERRRPEQSVDVRFSPEADRQPLEPEAPSAVSDGAGPRPGEPPPSETRAPKT